MDEIYLSSDIEEQIVQQLRTMGRSKKLHVVQGVLKFLFKAVPIVLLLAALATLLFVFAKASEVLHQQEPETVTTHITYSADGRTKTTTTTHTHSK